MPIKYGELTIIYNEEPNIITNLLVWLKCTEESLNKEKYIFLFEDGEIYEYNETITDFNFHFCCIPSKLPLYFKKQKQKEKAYFLKSCKINVAPICLLDFIQLFSLYTKYDSNLIIESKYNCIYNCYKHTFPDIFGIIKIKSTKIMPRFQFAYDSDEFTKQEIIYLIYTIFNKYLPNE